MKILRQAVAAVLVTVLAGCITTGGGGKPPIDPPKPPPQVAAVQVFEFTAPGVTVPGVLVSCNGTERGVTNGDGYLETVAITGEHFECVLTKDGYAPTTAAFRPQPQGPGCPKCGTLAASLTAIQPPKPDDPKTPNPIAGLLRIVSGIAYGDDTGLVLPTYAHAGDLFSIYVRDRARAQNQLDRVALQGFHGVRVWLNLGCGPDTPAGCTHGAYWKGREVGPEITPNYWGELHDFMADLSARKLRLVASQGDIGQLRDRRDFMQRLRAQDDANHVIDWLDCGNEAWQTGEPDPDRLAQCVGYFGSGSALRTLTDAPIYFPGAPPAHVTIDKYSIPPADAFDMHSFRGGHSWDKRRHIWGYTYCGEGCPRLKTGIGSEPPGNGRRVSAIDNRDELDDEAVALLAIASHLGRQAFVWFSGEGVIQDQGLQVEAGFTSVPRAVALLPRDVYTYETSHHSGTTFQGIRILEPAGEVRIDGRQAADGRFAYTIDGPAGSYRLRVVRPFNGELCNPGTGQCETVVKAAGDTLDLSFTRGRLLKGRRVQ